MPGAEFWPALVLTVHGWMGQASCRQHEEVYHVGGISQCLRAVTILQPFVTSKGGSDEDSRRRQLMWSPLLPAPAALPGRMLPAPHGTQTGGTAAGLWPEHAGTGFQAAGGFVTGLAGAWLRGQGCFPLGSGSPGGPGGLATHRPATAARGVSSLGNVSHQTALMQPCTKKGV